MTIHSGERILGLLSIMSSSSRSVDRRPAFNGVGLSPTRQIECSMGMAVLNLCASVIGADSPPTS